MIESAHALLAGLDPSDEMAFALAHGKLGSVHANEANAALGEFHLMVIPHASMHGASVVEGKNLHYVWMDFFNDTAGQAWLDNHKDVVPGQKKAGKGQAARCVFRPDPIGSRPPSGRARHPIRERRAESGRFTGQANEERTLRPDHRRNCRSDTAGAFDLELATQTLHTFAHPLQAEVAFLGPVGRGRIKADSVVPNYQRDGLRGEDQAQFDPGGLRVLERIRDALLGEEQQIASDEIGQRTLLPLGRDGNLHGRAGAAIRGDFLQCFGQRVFLKGRRPEIPDAAA